jgi:hypothetical protein
MTSTAAILGDLGQVVGILAGLGVVGGGSLKGAAAWRRKARAEETRAVALDRLLEELVAGHRDHDAHHALLEANEWTTRARPPATTGTPLATSRQADMRARLGTTSQR